MSEVGLVSSSCTGLGFEFGLDPGNMFSLIPVCTKRTQMKCIYGLGIKACSKTHFITSCLLQLARTLLGRKLEFGMDEEAMFW